MRVRQPGVLQPQDQGGTPVRSADMSVAVAKRQWVRRRAVQIVLVALTISTTLVGASALSGGASITITVTITSDTATV